MSFSMTLSGPSRPPASGRPAAQLVVLLHGYGADGNDLIGLAPLLAQALPDAHFVSPHAPFPCGGAPFGYQWFDVWDRSDEARIAGARAAAAILEPYIDDQLAALGLPPERLALVGFSQGTMMSLFTGLRRTPGPACILGYSGRLVGADLLRDEIAARPPVLLVHGDEDEMVPVDSMYQAVAGLEAVGVDVQSHVCHGLGHGIDEDGIALGARFLHAAFPQA